MNKFNTNYYYIASPGWSDKDKEELKFIEDTLDAQHMDYFSPFKHGGMLKLYDDIERSKVSVKVMFDENINQIKQATDMIARTEGWDKGTFFEIGLFIGLNHDFRYHLTLIGENSTEASNIIEKSYKQVESYMDKRSDNRAVVDISEKSIDRYVLLGILYSKGIEVITSSIEELSSNIMTACSVIGHVVCPNYPEFMIADEKGFLKNITRREKINREVVTLNLSAFKNSKSIK